MDTVPFDQTSIVVLRRQRRFGSSSIASQSNVQRRFMNSHL